MQLKCRCSVNCYCSKCIFHWRFTSIKQVLKLGVIWTYDKLVLNVSLVPLTSYGQTGARGRNQWYLGCFLQILHILQISHRMYIFYDFKNSLQHMETWSSMSLVCCFRVPRDFFTKIQRKGNFNKLPSGHTTWNHLDFNQWCARGVKTSR